uniref:ATP synthase complex subunit 8 n=1 Tax=Pedicinus badii TaxID=430776 RepID=A0A7H1K1A3_9NEOP|nr:ATP synthase subunit 8 [Pedicinus badii]
MPQMAPSSWIFVFFMMPITFYLLGSIFYFSSLSWSGDGKSFLFKKYELKFNSVEKFLKW